MSKPFDEFNIYNKPLEFHLKKLETCRNTNKILDLLNILTKYRDESIRINDEYVKSRIELDFWQGVKQFYVAKNEHAQHINIFINNYLYKNKIVKYDERFKKIIIKDLKKFNNNNTFIKNYINAIIENS